MGCEGNYSVEKLATRKKNPTKLGGIRYMVPTGGFEPPLAYANHPLKMACLPISPRRQGWPSNAFRG